MAYLTGNPKSLKEVKEGLKAGKTYSVFYPGLGSLPQGGGVVYLEGPHYPKPHKWYAKAQVDADGKLVKLLK